MLYKQGPRAKEKNLILISQIISYFFTVPLFLFCSYIINISAAALEIWGNTAEVNKFMSMPITDPILICGVVFTIVPLISNSLIAMYVITNYPSTKIYGKYWRSLFLFGGSVRSTLILINTNYHRDSENLTNRISSPKTKSGIFASKFYWGSAMTMFSTTPIIFMSSILVNAEKPFTTDEIIFSTNESTPNIVEIFADGLDINFLKEAFTEETEHTMKDFIGYDKAVTPGYKTYSSRDEMIVGSYMDVLRIEMDGLEGQQRLALGYENTEKIIGAETEQYIINTHGYSRPNSSSYANNWTGDPAFIEEEIPGITAVNWSGARDTLFADGDSDNNNLTADAIGYKFVGTTAVAVDDAKPAHVLINEAITHDPKIVDNNGKYSPFEKDILTPYVAWQNLMSSLISDLKEAGVYDNTMIVVWSDHGDHYHNEPQDLVKNMELVKNRAAAFIKYPHANNPGTFTWEDNPFYMGNIKNMQQQWVTDFLPNIENQKPTWDTIKKWTNENPNTTENKLFFTYLTKWSGTVSRFVGDKLLYYSRLTTGYESNMTHWEWELFMNSEKMNDINSIKEWQEIKWDHESEEFNNVDEETL